MGLKDLESNEANLQYLAIPTTFQFFITKVIFSLFSLSCFPSLAPSSLFPSSYLDLLFLISYLSSSRYNTIITFLITYLFDHSLLPSAWTKAIIQPLHKKGDINQPDKYRYISLLNICSKVYSSILDRRFNRWIELNNAIGKGQGGFKDCNTIDNIICMNAMIQKQLAQNKKRYVTFIDVRKAFDSINRNKLCHVWVQMGKFRCC